MTPATMRMTGIAFLIAAAVMSLLNLKRVADLRTFWVTFPLLIVGIAFILRARKRRL